MSILFDRSSNLPYLGTGFPGRENGILLKRWVFGDRICHLGLQRRFWLSLSWSRRRPIWNRVMSSSWGPLRLPPGQSEGRLWSRVCASGGRAYNGVKLCRCWWGPMSGGRKCCATVWPRIPPPLKSAWQRRRTAITLLRRYLPVGSRNHP